MVYVFKTSVKTKKEIRLLKSSLDKLLIQSNWNFDLEDCDRILRIDSLIENSEAIIKLLNDNDFKCEELTG